MRRGLVLICLLGLTGCAADPSVRYVEATSPAAVARAGDHLIDSFYLQRNQIHISLRDDGAPGKPPNPDMVVTDTRAEEPGLRLMILRDDKAWTHTSVSLAKVENSDLIDNAGVAVEDRRMEIIQTIGSAAKVLASIAPAAGPRSAWHGQVERLDGCDDFPAKACDLLQPSEAGVRREAQTRLSASGLSASWGAVPATAIPVSEFKKQLASRHVHGLYYSSCRSIEVSFSFIDIVSTPMREIDFHWRGKIADPRWIEFVRFPRKGNIRMHSQCGVSITSEADPTQSTAALLAAALSQAVAVKQAIDAPH